MSFTGEILVADIGGTHARFAIAHAQDGQVERISDIQKYKSSEHETMGLAYGLYREALGRAMPQYGAIAVAATLGAEVLHFTNSHWTIEPRRAADLLGLDDAILINDFGAVAHAAANLPQDQFAHVCGPKDEAAGQAEAARLTSIIGPGTGLGAAQLLRLGDGYEVIETESGHIGFAPVDAVDHAILKSLEGQYQRVSAERVVCGQGLSAIYHVLANIEGKTPSEMSNIALWKAALEGSDPLAAAALERFCLALGSLAGDLALAHGAREVIIAGGLGARIGSQLEQSVFAERFAGKGRFQSLMETIPVKRLLHPEPGLYGAAAAYLEHLRRAA